MVVHVAHETNSVVKDILLRRILGSIEMSNCIYFPFYLSLSLPLHLSVCVHVYSV